MLEPSSTIEGMPSVEAISSIFSSSAPTSTCVMPVLRRLATQLSAKAAMLPEEKLMNRSLPLSDLRSTSGKTRSAGTSTSSPPPTAASSRSTTAVDALDVVDALGALDALDALDADAASLGVPTGATAFGASAGLLGGCALSAACCACCASWIWASNWRIVESRSRSRLCSLARARLRVVASSGAGPGADACVRCG